MISDQVGGGEELLLVLVVIEEAGRGEIQGKLETKQGRSEICLTG
jgi:hypothetical protein